MRIVDRVILLVYLRLVETLQGHNLRDDPVGKESGLGIGALVASMRPRLTEWSFVAGFHLAGSVCAAEAEVLGRVFARRGLPIGFPDHLERYARRRRDGVESGPARLIDDLNVLHLQRENFPIFAHR